MQRQFQVDKIPLLYKTKTNRFDVLFQTSEIIIYANVRTFSLYLEYVRCQLRNDLAASTKYAR